LAGLWVWGNLLTAGTAEPIGNRPLLAYSVAALLLGGQLISVGLLAELIVANTRRHNPAYSLRETLGDPPPTA
ncbi:MAG: glycosyltransferase, partial [Planctomycetaceae bacterium]